VAGGNHSWFLIDNDDPNNNRGPPSPIKKLVRSRPSSRKSNRSGISTKSKGRSFLKKGKINETNAK